MIIIVRSVVKKTMGTSSGTLYFKLHVLCVATLYSLVWYNGNGP